MSDEKNIVLIWTMDYHQRLMHYEAEKKIALRNCNTQEEKDEAIRRLARKWSV